MARADNSHKARGRGRKAPSPSPSARGELRGELYAAVKPVLLRRGTGCQVKRKGFVRAVYASGALVALLLMGLFRRELMALAFMFGVVLLDTNQHSTPAAETYTAAQAAAFYTNANGGGNGTIRFTVQPTLASTSYVGGNFHALFADNSAHGGIWFNDATLEMYTAPGDAVVFSQALTWSALQTMTITIVTSGSRSVTISGATTGNGTFSFGTAPNYFDNTQDLGVGSLPGSSAFRFAGVIGDVDDGSTAITGTGAITFAADTVASTATATVDGTAAITLAADTVVSTAESTVVGAGAITLADDAITGSGVGSVAGIAAIQFADDTLVATGEAGVNGGHIILDDDVFAGTAAASIVGAGAIVFAADTTTATGATNVVGTGAIQLADDVVTGVGIVPLVGAGAIQLADDTVVGAGTGPGGFGPGARSSAIAPYGHSAATMSAPGGYLPGGGPADADGRVPTAVNTQTTGSTFYASIARAVAIAGSKDLTDNKGNTWTELRRDNYGTFDPLFAPWEAAVAVCLDGAGGVNHVVTTPSLVGDECHLAWDEIQQGHHLVSTSFAARLTGQVQISAPLSTNGPGWVYVDWFGAAPTFGAEGFVWTVTAIGEGLNVGDWQVCDSRLVNHVDGWFQWKRWRRYFSAKTTNIQLTINEVTLNPPQPAFFYAAAFQETEFVDGEAAITFADDTLSSTGVVLASGTGAIQLAPDTVVGTAIANVTSIGLAQSAADASVIAGSAVVSVIGDGAITFASDTTSGSGDVADGPVGTGTIQLADDTVIGTAEATLLGVGGIVSAPDTVQGSGAPSIAGTGAVVFAADTTAGVGAPNAAGEAAITLADDTTAGSGFVVDDGTIVCLANIVFADDVIVGVGSGPFVGEAAIVFADDIVAGVSVILPPLPPNIALPRPPRRPGEPGKLFNPRAASTTLHRNRDPGCSLAASLAPVADDMRQLLVDFGMRHYEVFSIVVRWSGGERHRGEASVISELPFLPVPKVKNVGLVNRELRPAGTVNRGDVALEGLSPRYTQDDILLLFPRELRAGEEHFIEIRMDARDKNAERQRYTFIGRPERRAFDWTVRLTAQDEARTRGGQAR